MDSAIVTWFASHRSAPLDALAVFLTFAGRAGLIFVAAAVIRGLSNSKLAMAAWQVVLAGLLAVLLADGILKPLVGRPRPYAADTALQTVGARPGSASFPSGHAAGSVAAAFVLAATWRRARAGIWLVAALVAVSRVYLGVHYPTDVLAGALVGWSAGWFALGRTVWRAEPAGAGSPRDVDLRLLRVERRHARPSTARRPPRSAALIAERGMTLVYGGSNVGMMRRLADAALDGGRPRGRRHPRAARRLGAGAPRPLRTARRPVDARAEGADGVARRRLRRDARRLRHARRVLRGADVGAARHPPEAVRAAERRRLLRPACVAMFARARQDGFLDGPDSEPLVESEPERLLERLVGREAGGPRPASALSTNGAGSL